MYGAISTQNSALYERENFIHSKNFVAHLVALVSETIAVNNFYDILLLFDCWTGGMMKMQCCMEQHDF